MSINENNQILVPNPNAYLVRVGQKVTCRYSDRPIIVAKRDDHGNVWEQVAPNHPAYNGPETLRYIGLNYREFEPAFITREKLAELFLNPAPELGY
jgi:hypothetical protein